MEELQLLRPRRLVLRRRWLLRRRRLRRLRRSGGGQRGSSRQLPALQAGANSKSAARPVPKFRPKPTKFLSLISTKTPPNLELISSKFVRNRSCARRNESRKFLEFLLEQYSTTNKRINLKTRMKEARLPIGSSYQEPILMYSLPARSCPVGHVPAACRSAAQPTWRWL